MNDYSHDQPQTRSAPPPVSSALYDAFQAGNSGVLLVLIPDGTKARIRVRRGRVVGVEHQGTSPTAIIGLLQRTGLLDAAGLATAERTARKRNEPLDDAVVSSGLVSMGTLTNIREQVQRETVLELMLVRDLTVDPDWGEGASVGRETCALPIPFLLKEAQRRYAESGPIRRLVPRPDAVFVRTADIEGEQESWENLAMGPAERQVYFFVNGERSVEDLAVVTCQSLFSTMRAMASLVESGDVQPRLSDGPVQRGPGRRSSLLLRISAMIAVTCALAGLIFALAGTASKTLGRAASEAIFQDPFRRLHESASVDRLVGAVRLYDLMFGEPPESFHDLLDERLVEPSDIRAAATFAVDGRFLLQPEQPFDDGATVPREDNVQDPS